VVVVHVDGVPDPGELAGWPACVSGESALKSCGDSWLVDVVWLCSPSVDLAAGGVADGSVDGRT
jgi:hypothetical protein